MARFDGLKIDQAASNVGRDQCDHVLAPCQVQVMLDLNSDALLVHVCGTRGSHSFSITEVAPAKVRHVL